MAWLPRLEQADEPSGDEARRWVTLVLLFEAAQNLRVLRKALTEPA